MDSVLRVALLILLVACTELRPGGERRDADVRDADTVDAHDAGSDVPDACADPPIGGCLPSCLRPRVTAGLTRVGVGHSIDADQEWDCNSIWVLEDDTYVESPRTLTIAAGTRIEAMPGASLVVTDGARLVVEGTRDAPVVIRPPSPFEVGDEWRGLYLLGDAPVLDGDGNRTRRDVNRLHTVRSEHGGDDEDHDCGSLSHLRLEFGGLTRERTEGESLFIGGCGDGTVIDHVQVHESSDDAIVMHGGGFHLRNVVVSASDRDALQWERGWNGTVQYYIAHLLAGSTYAVLQGEGPIAGATPPSSAVVANMTTVSQGTGTAVIVEGSALTIANSITIQREELLHVREPHRDAWGLGQIEVVTSILFSPEPFFEQSGLEVLYAPPMNGNSALDPTLPASGTNPDLRLPSWRPMPGSTATTVFGDLPPGPLEPSRLEATNYAGAVDPNPDAEEWTAGWTAFPSN